MSAPSAAQTLTRPDASWVLIALLSIAVVGAVIQLVDRRGGTARPGYLTDPRVEWGHLAMAAVMLAMVTTSVSPVLWQWVVGVIALTWLGLGLAEVLGSGGAHTYDRVAAATYHCLAALAMLYAGFAHSGAGHHSGATAAHALPVPVLGVLAAALFVVDGLAVVLITAAPAGAVAPRPRPRDALPHVAMDIAMAAMLIDALW